MRPKQPVQRNSFSSLSSLNRPPPGFEGFRPQNDKTGVSQFSKNRQPDLDKDRGFSPSIEGQSKMVKRKPTFTKSSQNWIPPLEEDDKPESKPEPKLEPKQDLNLALSSILKDTNSKNKNGSDSLSDDNDRYLIKEESNDDDEEEEKKVSKTSPSIPISKFDDE